MDNFNSLNFKIHPFNKEGLQARHFFPNGYGVSVVRFNGSYGYPKLWELAVLKGTAEKSDLTYDTPITNDVMGYLTEEDVTGIMEQVQKL